MDLEIRNWKLTDAGDLSKIISNIKIQNNLRDGIPYPYTEQDGLDYISSMLSSDKDKVFAFAVTAGGQSDRAASAFSGRRTYTD